MSPERFAEAVRIYCAYTKASGTSSGRTAKHNKAVGGVPTSAHQFWLAIDVVYDEPLPIELRKDVGARLGLTVIVEGDHDHLQPAGWRAG